MKKLEKVNMKKKTLRAVAPSRGDYGFTAVEIAMVAAVIAILSLIVLPIFRNRVEEAKISAAKADLNALMKAQMVVKADIDAYARLEDLDNVELLGYTAAPAGGVDKEVPFFKYVKPVDGGVPADTRQILTPAQRQQLAGQPNMPNWKGPYIAFQNSITYQDLAGTINVNNMRRSTSGNILSAIQDVYAGSPYSDHNNNRYPIDPWGNPYMFFAPTGNSSNPANPNNEFPTAAIYCLGPNGVPGDGSGGPAAYLREFTLTNPTSDGRLGADDDLMVEF